MSKEVRHLIDNIDFTKEEILDILELIKILKNAYKEGCVPQLLKGASLAMLFEEPSTRTRVSFENAMHELGGHALFLAPEHIHFGSHEALCDTAKVLSGMCAGIMFRADKHETIQNFAKYATVPVINAMTCYNHPTQGICDVFTMIEHLPEGKKLEDLHIVFVGDSSDTGIMARETGHWCATLGLKYTIASPKKYSLNDSEIQKIQTKMKETGGRFTITDDVDEAVKDADFIIPDVWIYYGYEDEKEDRMAAFMPKYQLNMELLNKAPDHCKALHCLPANRGLEITSEVMDHPTRSLVFQEAENRLHAERGLLAWFLYPMMNRPSEEQKTYHSDRVKEFVDARF